MTNQFFKVRLPVLLGALIPALVMAEAAWAINVPTKTFITGQVTDNEVHRQSCSTTGTCSIAFSAAKNCAGAGALSAQASANASLVPSTSPTGGVIVMTAQAGAKLTTNCSDSFFGNIIEISGHFFGPRIEVFAQLNPNKLPQVLLTTQANMTISSDGQVGGNPSTATVNFSDLCSPQGGFGLDSGLNAFNSSASLSKSLSCTVSPGFREAGTDFFQVQVLSIGGEAFARAFGHPNSQSSSIFLQSDFKVIGSVMQQAGGDGQTGPAGRTLPQPLVVQVSDDVSLKPVKDAVITFGLLKGPGSGASFSAFSVLTDTNGIASTTLTLGASSGTYVIQAACGDCVANQTLEFTETATSPQKSIALIPIFCDGSGFVQQSLPNPMRVQAFNNVTGRGEPNLAVHFTLIQSPAGAVGMGPASFDSATDSDGIASLAFTLGDTVGAYVVRAVCPDCLANTTVLCPASAIQVPNLSIPIPGLPVFTLQTGIPVSASVPGTPVPPAPGTTLAVAPQIPIDQSLAPFNNTAAISVSGAPPNAPLAAFVTALPFSGGHQHDSGALSFRPIGTLSGVPPATDGSGSAQFTYTSNVAGGDEFVNVQATDSAGNVKLGNVMIEVSVPGIDPAGQLARNDAAYLLTGQTDFHPNDHWGTAFLKSQIALLAQAFISSMTLSGGGVLGINDMSLINGGIFDLDTAWDAAKGHLCHRQGTSVDLDRSKYIDHNPIRIKNFANQIQVLLQQHSEINCRRVIEPLTPKGECKAHLECPATAGCPSSTPTCSESGP